MKHHKANLKLPKGWKKGAPPHVGWWRTKDRGLDCGEYRFWNGESWSIFVLEHEDCAGLQAEASPNVYTPEEYVVSWKYYWPKNARVARINPQTGECTGAGPCPYETAGMSWPFKKGGKK